jgi:DNA-binding NarL/FixJ family response regulator
VQGRVVLPIGVMRALSATEPAPTPPDDTPAPHELEWLHHLAAGQTISQVANRVGYSERMMFRLLRQLYDRLHVRGRTEALMLARQRGWL